MPRILMAWVSGKSVIASPIRRVGPVAFRFLGIEQTLEALVFKGAAPRKVYWQGPSIGYDFGGEGSKTMVLVYNLRDPMQIYERYAGVQGSAYIVGGVGIQFQTHGNVTLAPIRAGIGLRLGANVGYLKYTQEPTWNPF